TQPSLSVAQDAVIVKEDAAEFNTYYSKGSMGLRKVVEKEKDQTKVWDKVEEINDKNKTQTATKTYTAISSSNSFSKNLDAYLEFFNGKFADPNIIGLVVVTGSRVMGCDLFATNALFKGQLQSLLHSYATEAILNGAPVTASSQTVKNYMDRLLKDENAQKQTLKEKGSAFVHDGKKLRVSSFD
ncbi:MAG: ARPP-1 family domain-containing protein, partial [Flavisolibacter sp.]